MIYVGIDIAKLNHFASAISSEGEILIDPSVYQSGNFQAKKTRMSKRGSRVLRYALMNAAHNVVKNNATFKAYYDAKRAEGRTHYNALGHCAVPFFTTDEEKKFFANLGLTFHSWSPHIPYFFHYTLAATLLQLQICNFSPLRHCQIAIAVNIQGTSKNRVILSLSKEQKLLSNLDNDSRLIDKAANGTCNNKNRTS